MYTQVIKSGQKNVIFYLKNLVINHKISNTKLFIANIAQISLNHLNCYLYNYPLFM